MYDALFSRLAKSKFRSRFLLGKREQHYFSMKGREVICAHARGFVLDRLAPAFPRNDGEQTPMRGHPVFIAQHATATCCRGCLSKWHRIEVGRELSPAEQAYVVDILMEWIDKNAPTMRQMDLFEGQALG